MTDRAKPRVLFLCTGNACRSQMAEGFARALHGEWLEPSSAGVAPAGLDPRAVVVMKEAGVDISSHTSKGWGELDGRGFDLVVTVCDAARDACPVPPSGARVLHASFEDPPRLAAREVTEAAALAHYRRVRDEIRSFVAGLTPGDLEAARR